PLFRLQARLALQLLGQGALLEGYLLGMRQMLQGATTTLPGQRTGCRAAQVAGLQHLLHACFHLLTACRQHARLYLLAGQRATDEPGASLGMGNAPAIMGQSFNAEYLLLAHRQAAAPRATRRLQAQP